MHNLQNNILAFWEKHAVDDLHGGFIGQVDSDNRQVIKANKGVILNTRLLWTFSAVYLYFQDDKYLILAKRAWNYLSDHFRDINYGGLYWELNFLGEPVNRRKLIYAQVFAIYALTTYYKATGKKEAIEWAIEIYHLIERKSFEPIVGAYIEAFTQNWSSVTDYRLSEKDLNTPFTLNTHLHILEAYTSLYRVWKDDGLRITLQRLIHLLINKFPDNQGHLVLFFSKTWEPVQRVCSFGHEIEFSWLLTEAANTLDNKAIIRSCEKMTLKIVELVIREGFDSQRGGIMYECDLDSGIIDTDKHWWPQAEALVGFLNAYQINRKNKYLELFLKTWDFIDNYIADHENGEWYWKVSKEGRVYHGMEKAGFWKCPYHNSRAILETLRRFEKFTPS